MTEWWGQHQVGGEEPAASDASGNGVGPSLRAVPKPVGSSILWTPRSWDSAESGEIRAVDLFVWQAALKEIASHLSAPGGREGYGMFSGRLARCPESDTSYLSIEEAHPAPHSMPEGEDPASLARFREFWLSLSLKVSAHDRALVGWYHAHPRLGISFSKSDERIHLAHFPNRWQCALVLTSQTTNREAGFFQRDSRTGAFRSTPAAFYEVLPRRKLNGGRAKSWVSWCNYKPDRSVENSGMRSREAAFEFVLDASESAAVSDSGTLQGNGANGQKGRANGDEASAETGGAPAPSDLVTHFVKARKKQRRRRLIRRLASATAILAAAAGALTTASATGRVDLAAMVDDARFQTRAVARALAETLIPTNQTTADGQAGAVPMARGQGPGAPSANSDMDFASPPGDARQILIERIQEYERVGTAAAYQGATAACGPLTAAFRQVEAAAATPTGGPEGPAISATDGEGLVEAIEAVRRDYDASGCASSD
ncbi:MAG: hypothetical protein P8Y07_05205 [Gemmatimonadales bacterium]|jgi:hypothetical protein